MKKKWKENYTSWQIVGSFRWEMEKIFPKNKNKNQIVIRSEFAIVRVTRSWISHPGVTFTAKTPWKWSRNLKLTLSILSQNSLSKLVGPYISYFFIFWFATRIRTCIFFLQKTGNLWYCSSCLKWWNRQLICPER